MMKALYISSVLLGLLQLVFATLDDLIVLEPLPRHFWDASLLQKRDETSVPANITLTDHEQMLWTTPPNNTHPTTVSMVVWTGQDRLIVDMAKFAFELKSARCKKDPDLMVQFRHEVSWQAAKKNWDWVNFNGMRSFVLIADHILCGWDWSLEPWLVSSVTFNETDLTIHMDAEKKDWKTITQSYALDFGENTNTQQTRKRFIDYNFDESFTLPLSSSWPTAILTEDFGAATFGVSCTDCGTKGSLVFAGHIEGSVTGGIDKFMVSATPHGIEANLNLDVSFGGSKNFGDEGKKEIDLMTIPLPAGWTIPGVLTFGPNAIVRAGFQLDSISGTATMSTGVSAKIPEDSFAKVDLFAQNKVDVHGWVPTFETKPLSIEAQLSAKAELYTALAVAVSLEVLDENGVNVDVNLKFPKIKVTATGGHDPNGFCPNNPAPFGVSLDVWLGAELALEGWDELDGKRHELFDVNLFVSDEMFHFPVFCKSWGDDGGDGPGGSCDISIPEEDQDWYDNEIGSPDPELARRHPHLSKRANRIYYLKCDSGQKYPVKLKGYPLPSTIKKRGQAGVEVPVMLPGIFDCSDDDSTKCYEDHWKIDEATDAAMSSGNWNAEHVYEGDWIKEFLDDLYDKYYAGQGVDAGCAALAAAFNVGQATGPLNDMLDQVGTSATYKQTMTILPLEENGLKHRMFSSSVNIDAKFENEAAAGYKLCRIGRVVNACQYMMKQNTTDRLRNTIHGGYLVDGNIRPGIDNILRTMDANAAIAKPSGLSSWQAEHQNWFVEMYGDGILKAQVNLIDYAWELLDAAGFDAFPEATKTTIRGIAGGGDGVEKWCHNTFQY